MLSPRSVSLFAWTLVLVLFPWSRNDTGTCAPGGRRTHRHNRISQTGLWSNLTWRFIRLTVTDSLRAPSQSKPRLPTSSARVRFSSCPHTTAAVLGRPRRSTSTGGADSLGGDRRRRQRNAVLSGKGHGEERIELLYRRSVDGGLAWGPPMSLGGGHDRRGMVVDPLAGSATTFLVSSLGQRDQSGPFTTAVYVARADGVGPLQPSARVLISNLQQQTLAPVVLRDGTLIIPSLDYATPGVRHARFTPSLGAGIVGPWEHAFGTSVRGGEPGPSGVPSS